MADKLLNVIGVVIGLIACVPLWFVRVIGVVLSILWFAITLILLGVCKLESLLETALTGEEPEDDAVCNMMNEMITALKNIKKSMHK